MKCALALKVLAESALSAAATDEQRLAVFDSVAVVAAELDLATEFTLAREAAKAMREADARQMAFRDFLDGSTRTPSA